jgi:hypothetical protein
MFSTISFNIYKNLRHSSVPILLLPCSTFYPSFMRLLNYEMRSAGLGNGCALCDALTIFDVLLLCFSLDALNLSFSLLGLRAFSLTPARMRSILTRVVLLVLREFLAERVRERSSVCVVCWRYGLNGSGEWRRS